MKPKKNKVDILGTQYTLIEDSVASNPKLINQEAYIEWFAKEIVYETANHNLENPKKLEEHDKRIIRHEIVHAFFRESGLQDYSNDEVLVDWIALQFGKIEKVFNELGIEEDK